MRTFDQRPFYLKGTQAGGRTWDLWGFVYFLSLKQRFRPLGHCAPQMLPEHLKESGFEVEQLKGASFTRSQRYALAMASSTLHHYIFRSFASIAIEEIHALNQLIVHIWASAVQFKEYWSGPWWWYSGQHSRLLLRRYQFDSSWLFNFQSLYSCKRRK